MEVRGRGVLRSAFVPLGLGVCAQVLKREAVCDRLALGLRWPVCDRSALFQQAGHSWHEVPVLTSCIPFSAMMADISLLKAAGSPPSPRM